MLKSNTPFKAGIVLAVPFTAESLDPENVKGRIVVAMRGGSSFAQKALVAQAAGAVALIIVQSIPDVWPFVPDDSKKNASELKIPVFAISLEAGQRLKAHLETDRPLFADKRLTAELVRLHDDDRSCPICTGLRSSHHMNRCWPR